MAIYQGIFFHRKKWKKSWYFYWYSFIKNNEKLKKMAFPRKQTVEPSWDEARDRQKCYQLHQHGSVRGGIIETLTSLFVDPYRGNILLKTIHPIIRSHHGGYTASHPNCEVKHHWARSVLRWGTTRESRPDSMRWLTQAANASCPFKVWE